MVNNILTKNPDNLVSQKKKEHIRILFLINNSSKVGVLDGIFFLNLHLSILFETVLQQHPLTTAVSEYFCTRRICTNCANIARYEN